MDEKHQLDIMNQLLGRKFKVPQSMASLLNWQPQWKILQVAVAEDCKYNSYIFISYQGLQSSLGRQTSSAT